MLMMVLCDREGRVYDVCDSKDMRAKRQVVEGVISQIKLFNAGSGWRTLTCVLVYTYARKADEHRRRPKRWPYNGGRGKKKKGTA